MKGLKKFGKKKGAKKKGMKKIKSFSRKKLNPSSHSGSKFALARPSSGFRTELVPWYRGFSGEMKKARDPETKREYFVSQGIIKKTGQTTVEITELPVKKWTQDYKEFLQGLCPGGGDPDSSRKHKPLIQSFREYHTENTVHFEVNLSREQMASAEGRGLYEVFRLRTNLSVSNLVLFDQDGKIRKYNSAIEILREFLPVRLAMYGKRKAHLLVVLQRQCEFLRQKVSFIKAIIGGRLKVANVKKDKLVRDLAAKKFLTKAQIERKYCDQYMGPEEVEEGAVSSSSASASVSPEGEDSGASSSSGPSSSSASMKKLMKKGRGGPSSSSGSAGPSASATGFEYLLNMAIWTLTYERVQELSKELAEKEAAFRALAKTSPEELWTRDLQKLSKALDLLDELDKELLKEESRLKGRGGRRVSADDDESGDESEGGNASMKRRKRKAGTGGGLRQKLLAKLKRGAASQEGAMKQRAGSSMKLMRARRIVKALKKGTAKRG